MSAPNAAARTLHRLADPANRLGAILGVAVLLTATFAAFRVPPIIQAIAIGPGHGASDDGADTVKLYAAAMTRDVDQINGRSFFFDPPPPPPPVVRRPDPPKHEEPKYTPPPPPATYGGPKVVGTAMDTVWFDNGKTMRVGGPLESDMRILSIRTAPYVVRIEWKGVEFDVPFLSRDRVVFKGGPGAPGSEPEPEPPAPEPPANTASTTPPPNPTSPPSTAPPSTAPPASPSPPAAGGAPKPADSPAKPPGDPPEPPKDSKEKDRPPAPAPQTPPEKPDTPH